MQRLGASSSAHVNIVVVPRIPSARRVFCTAGNRGTKNGCRRGNPSPSGLCTRTSCGTCAKVTGLALNIRTKNACTRTAVHTVEYQLHKYQIHYVICYDNLSAAGLPFFPRNVLDLDDLGAHELTLLPVPHEIHLAERSHPQYLQPLVPFHLVLRLSLPVLVVCCQHQPVSSKQQRRWLFLCPALCGYRMDDQRQRCEVFRGSGVFRRMLGARQYRIRIGRLYGGMFSTRFARRDASACCESERIDDGLWHVTCDTDAFWSNSSTPLGISPTVLHMRRDFWTQ